ncbi:hypothetical protein H5410_048627 [Solanum commersonii]|uniref:C2H2-type domain-containing protein n=1 Tax=Solanum commersonii TaxID=4109 RepID=A0A9J5XIM9_SOLCO|nr:hypothetical protein H5410_048627 [Solanum commersonii]
MNNANLSPPSSLLPCRVFLRCPLCYGAFRTHMEFMNHVRTTHLLLSERNIILCSHAYASNTLSPTTPLRSNLEAPQHASSQNVIQHSSGYPLGTLLRENILSTQSTEIYHQFNMRSHNMRIYKMLSNVLLYMDQVIFLQETCHHINATPQHASSRTNDNVVIPPTLSSNRNNPIRSDRAPPIDWQQMARSNRVGGPNSTFLNSNESIIDCTRSLINQLNVRVSANVDESVNIADEQNDLDLTLRL